MKPPLWVRPLTDAERTPLDAERRGANAFRMRRAQLLLASGRGLSPTPIAPLVGCTVQTVRHVIHALHTTALGCVPQPSTRPKRVTPIRDAAHGERLQHLLPQSPRTDGKSTGVWRLARAARVCDEPGVTERCLSEDTIRRVWQRLRTTWTRATPWSTSPDPHDARKKSGAIA